MTPKELKDIELMEEFNRVKDSLNLSDRQRKVFYYKYSRFWRNADIAAELDVHPDTISDDLTVIRTKLLAINRDELEQKN